MNTNVKMGNLTRSWGGLTGSAKTITLQVTENCNLACKYCYMTGKNDLKKMNFETAKKAIDYILSDTNTFKEKSVIWEFIGGEPFIEIELIDKITDYIKLQTFILDHPWFNSYRLSFSSNGILYDTPDVQRYIQKNKFHLSIGISVDGNKVKHDLQRVKLDGSGSYDDVMKIVPLWLSQFPNVGTKATFSHDDIPYLKDSIISLWNNDIKTVSANVVFEDVWQEGDDLLLEQQLKDLADYVIENKLWDKYSVRFFDPTIGNALSEEDKKRNYCGAGKMLAIDCDGNFVPCVRFYNISLNNKKPLFIGNADTGIIQDKLRPFLALDLKSQSPMDCINCDVASGCAWCQGCNYDFADTDTIYQRATYICKMHKATVRANKYFWEKFENDTGLTSERKNQISKEQKEKNYLLIITNDNITPHCSYRNSRKTNNVMSPELFLEGLKFCKLNNFVPVILGKPLGVDSKYYQDCFLFDKAGEKGNSISIYDNSTKIHDEVETSILLVNKQNIISLLEFIEDIYIKANRINLVISDLDEWNEDNIEQYRIELDKVVAIITDKYIKGKEVELNVLTDLWDLKSMRNCEAGNNSYSLAPNGKIYLCPAFYFNDDNTYIGSIRDDIRVNNSQLLNLENAPICSLCDVYNCNRCKFLNLKMTNEIHIPSKNQCIISHIERELSVKLQNMLIEDGYEDFQNKLTTVNYYDPLEKKLMK